MTLIRVIDLETTGLEPTDAVVEIGAVDVALNTHTGELARVDPLHSDLVFPGRDIPPQASAIHHIVDSDVVNAKRWEEVTPFYFSPEVGFYAAHRAAFEEQWLTHGLRKDAPLICTLKAAYRVWPDAPGHSNQTLRYWLVQQPDSGFPNDLDRDFSDNAHRAWPDALITAWILVALLKKASLSDIVAWSKEPPLLPTCPIGKKRGWYGKKWSEIDEGSLKWMIREITDDPDLVWNAKRELNRRWDEETAKRSAYVDWFKKVITTEAPYSVADLEQRFREERDESFPLYGITPNTGEYKIIVAACAERKAQLLKEQEHASAA